MPHTALSFSKIVKLNKSDADIDKFNPYHDAKGRFTTSGGGASFSGTLLHGSPNKGIKEFDISRAGSNTGSGEKLLFFTNDKQLADDFSYERLPGSTKFVNVRGKKGEVYRTKVKMKKPLDLRNLSDDDIKAVKQLDADGILTDSDIKTLAGMKNHGSLKAALDLRPETLSRLGYDGIIANAGNGKTEFAVIDSKQTKIIHKTFSEVMESKASGSVSLVDRWENDKNPFKVLNHSDGIEKFNPYHDRLGRFSTDSGASSFTWRPGASAAHDNAIAREKERMASGGSEYRGHIEPKGHKSGIETVKQELGCDEKQAKKYTKGIQSFTSENYEAIRAYQSGKKNDYTKKFSRDAKAVEDYIDKAPKWNDGTLYRGINVESGDVKSIFKPGTELDMQGTSSWSSEKRIADSYTFGSGTKVIFQCDKISKATSITHISNNPSEKEVLVSKDTKYVAKKVSKKGKYYYVYLDEITGSVAKSEEEFMNEKTFHITKADEDQRLVFGWALVAERTDGETIIDHQGDMVYPDELEKGAYEYVLNFRDAGEEHIGTLRKKAKMVESCVFTPEKMKALGIPEGTVPVGWWIGFHVDDDDTWEKIKNGTYNMFSIEGKAVREPVNEPVTKAIRNFDEFPEIGMWYEENMDATEEDIKAAKEYYDKKKKTERAVAKTFSEVLKFNPYHDRLGRFSSANGAASFTYAPGKSKSHDNAIERERERAKQRAASGGGGSNSDNQSHATSNKIKQEFIDHGLNSKFAGIRRRAQEGTEGYSYKDASPVSANEALKMKGMHFVERDGKTLVHGTVDNKKVFFADSSDSDGIKALHQKNESRKQKQLEDASHSVEDPYKNNTTTYDRWKKNHDKNFEAWFGNRLKKSNEYSGRSMTFNEILKFNPYHDRLGRNVNT